MTIKRQIDDRDVDRLLSALSDVQIANVFGMPLHEVYALRQCRKTQQRSEAKAAMTDLRTASLNCM